MRLPVLQIRPSPALVGYAAMSGIIAVVALIQIASVPEGRTGWYVPIVLTSAIWIAVHLTVVVRSFTHAYLFSTSYLAALILFHLSLYYQRVLGVLAFPAEWETGGFASQLEAAGWYVCLALAAFGIGFAMAILRQRPQREMLPADVVSYSKASGNWAAVGLLLASAVFLAFAFRSYGNLLDYARHEIFSATADSRGLGAFMMVFPGAVALYFFTARTGAQRAVSYALVAFAFLTFMLTGYRSAALFPALVGVAIWVKSGRRLPIAAFVGACFLVLVLIAASGYLRTLGKFSELSVEKVSSALAVASVDQGITNMGGTVQVIAHVVDFVPATSPYRYGLTYFRSLIDAVPNITGRANYEASREYAVQRMASDPTAVDDMRPAEWLTYRIAPWHFDHGYGVGFSAIAEAYMNFGTVGVIVIFILIGFALGRLDCANLFASPWLVIFASTMLWSIVRTVRNDSSNLFKPVVFVAITLALWWIFSRLFLGKRALCPWPWERRRRVSRPRVRSGRAIVMPHSTAS
jgi:oligosaccharide repeat unit polymerase